MACKLASRSELTCIFITMNTFIHVGLYSLRQGCPFMYVVVMLETVHDAVDLHPLANSCKQTDNLQTVHE